MRLRSKISYLVLAVVSAALMLLLAIWLPNLSFIEGIVFSNGYSISQKWGILIASLEGLRTNFTPLSRSLIIINSLLSGINLSLLVYFLRQRLMLAGQTGTSLAASR